MCIYVRASSNNMKNIFIPNIHRALTSFYADMFATQEAIIIILNCQKYFACKLPRHNKLQDKRA